VSAISDAFPDAAPNPADPATPPDAPTVEEMLTILIESRIACLGCTADRFKAEHSGTPEDQLPDVNSANLIINGMGQCYRHVQVADGPVVPGQLPSGLYLPGQGG
jgi:hypothetical protein